MLPETTTFKVLNKTLCNYSSILLLKKSNFKVGWSARFLGGTGGKIRLKLEKLSFSQGLGCDFFQVVPDTSEHSILHLF